MLSILFLQLLDPHQPELAQPRRQRQAVLLGSPSKPTLLVRCRSDVGQVPIPRVVERRAATSFWDLALAPWSSVFGLLFSGGPPAVARLVVATVVDAIDGVFGGWSGSHVCDERV